MCRPVSGRAEQGMLPAPFPRRQPVCGTWLPACCLAIREGRVSSPGLAWRFLRSSEPHPLSTETGGLSALPSWCGRCSVLFPASPSPVALVLFLSVEICTGHQLLLSVVLKPTETHLPSLFGCR